MLRSANVATPPIARTVVRPERDPPLALAPRPRVTSPTKAVAAFANRSSAESCTAGRRGRPANVFAGGTEKASWLGGPGFASDVKATRNPKESGEPGCAGRSASDVCPPANVPKVHNTEAIPEASV